MKRALSASILNDLEKKVVILSGPRQCGKTYLGKNLISNQIEYLNFDVPSSRRIIIKGDWAVNRDLLIFDEVHKMKKWKNWLKGVIDANDSNQKILVTGSAKLNTYKKVGDSLAGRYFSYRLYPFDLKEILSYQDKKESAESILDRLLMVSGFPEPYLEGTVGHYNRWQQTHLDAILKQDILETESVRNIKQLETLALLLTERVGSTLSYNSLREDLSTDDKSIRRWVDILENSYVIFRIYPFYHKSIAGSLKKAPKLYFYDYCRVDKYSNRLENLVASSLLKEIHFRMDTRGEVYDLNYLRNKQGKEIDFLITKNKKPYMMIEVKESDSETSKIFEVFEKALPNLKKVQLVKNLKEERLTKKNVLISPMREWLAKMDF